MVLSAATKKGLGVYYTPDRVADVLVRWALNGSSGRIFDPTFGGCSFLRASLKHLGSLGTSEPGHLIFGVDIDPSSLPFTKELLDGGVPRRNLIFKNFFDVRSQDLGSFRAVVGNPPYIRHHSFIDSARARRSLGELSSALPKTSSSWVYFVLHALSFLERGGRMALLLPVSVLQAEYSSSFLQEVQKNFARVSLFSLKERIFSEADEQTVFLLGEGFGEGPCSPQITTIDDFESFTLLLTQTDVHQSEGLDGWKLQRLDDQAREVWLEVVSHADVGRLGDVADIKIGVVTGANSFFVRLASDELLKRRSIGLVPAVTTSRWLKIPSWRESDQLRIETMRQPSRLLVLSGSGRLPKAMLAEIKTAEKHGLDSRFHCSKRDPWYALVDIERPDAFLPYMGSSPSGMSLNRADATCTNAVHRIEWKLNRLSSGRKGLIAASWTSLFLLGYELFGRSYGGGVLKVEPSEAKRIPIPYFPEIHQSLALIDRAARRFGREAAVTLADELILVKGLGLSARKVAAMRRALVDLHSWRQRVRSKP